MTGRQLLSGLVPVIAGFSVWAIGFVLLYGLNAVGCQAGWHQLGSEPFTTQRLMLIVLLLATLAAIALTALAFRRKTVGASPDEQRFVLRVGWWSSVAAFVASLFTFAPVLVLSTCL
jgi:magnesium-transporting ATPase (P-type)